MNVKRQLAVLAGAVLVLGLAVGIAGAGTPRLPAEPSSPRAAIEAVRAGQGKVLPTHAADIHLAAWDGCHFVFKTSHNHVVEAPDHTKMNVSDPPEPDDAAAARPPGCVDREPTQAEIDAMQARLNALSTAAANEANRLNGVPGTIPPPPPMQVTPRG